MRCLIDLDGVCCNLLAPWLASYNMLGGEFLTPSEIHTYDMRSDVKDYEKLFRALGHVEYGDVFPFESVGAAILLLRSAGLDLRFVSHVPESAPTHYAGKLAWCKEHIPLFSAKELIFCASEEKQFIDGDYLIEDYVRTLEQWWFAGNGNRAFLISHPYNMCDKGAFTRVSSLLDAAHRIVK